MMRLLQRALLIGGFFVFFVLGSSALMTSAQTANTQCPAGQFWLQCGTSGWCATAGSVCPATSGTSTNNTTTTNNTTATQCSQGQISCWDTNNQRNYCHSGSMCPLICMSGQVKCPNLNGGGEYCYQGSSCPSATNTNTGSGSTGTQSSQTCTSPQWWCGSKSKCVTTAVECDGSSTTGSNTTAAQCSQGQMSCWDPSTQKSYCHNGTTCPMICGSDMTKITCSDISGKSYEMCASKSNPTCPMTAGSGTSQTCAAPQWWCGSKSKCVTTAAECDGGTTTPANTSTGTTMSEEQMKTECLKQSNMKWCPSGSITKGFCAQTTWDCKNGYPGMTEKCSTGLLYCGDSSTRKAGCYSSCSEEVADTPQKRCEQQAAKEPSKWKWCKSQSMGSSSQGAGYDGWCADTTSQWYQPCDESECKAKSGWNWCKSSWTDSWSGKTQTNYWCSKECPIDDESSCKAAGREWCEHTAVAMNMTPASSTKGYCAMKDASPCTKARCEEKKGAKWCMPKYGGSGWCSMNGTCPDDEVVIFHWPDKQDQCLKYSGNWCANKTSMSGGWCMMGTEECMDSNENKGKVWCWWESKFADKWDDCQKPPQKQEECTAQGRNWCEPQMMNYTPASGTASMASGWCSKTICPKSGLNNCPDGKTLAKKLEDCPTKAITGQKCWDGSISNGSKCPPEPKVCASGFSKDSSTGECVKSCPNGSKKIKEGELCSDIGNREGGELTDKEKETLKKKESRAAELQQYAAFFRQVRSEKIASEIEKLLTKLADDQRYILSYWTEGKFEEIDKNIAALKVAKEAAEKRGTASDETEFKVDIEKAAIDDIRNSLGLTNNEQRLTELLDATLPNLEKEGVSVNEGVKNRLNDAAKIIGQIKEAETIDEVNKLGQNLALILKTINDKDRPYLKGLLGVKSMTDWYTQQIDDVEMMLIGNADAEVVGLKQELAAANFNPTANFAEITKLITEARTAVSDVKAGKQSADPLGYLKRTALQKLSQAQDEMNDLGTLLELGDFMQSISGKGGYIEKYQTQLNALKKSRTAVLSDRKIAARDRTAKARTMLTDINRLQSDVNTLRRMAAQLKTLSTQKTKVNVTRLVDQLNDLIDRREGVRPEATVQDELKQLEGSFELPTFDLPALKGAFLGTQGISQLFGKQSRVLVKL